MDGGREEKEEVSKSKTRKGNSWIRTKGGEDFFFFFGIGNDGKRSAIIAENADGLIWFADRSASIRGRRAERCGH